MNKFKAKGMMILLAVIILIAAVPFCAFSADTSFEEEIKAFPESYKPYLRQLHEKYPEWSFVPMDTGLDWETVIDNEISKPTTDKNDKKSLVDSSSAVSKIFKSTASSDYNKDTGVYKQWDGGFVAANRLAVSYFMDPRNFLSEDNIFQFELLSYDERHTVDAVEIVLKGSFMSETAITYYDSEGNKEKIDKTYGEAIFEAGKKFNINPCYLASKILNEVGTSGSSSVSGKHSVYPGVYNFYNIGASDGTGAIERGLKWANSNTTYGRPWTTPVKSIEGGAEYLAATYIKNGQFTGYLQRFNVNPDAYYKLYTHQYMTNLTGALSQGYTTYKSYAKSGLLYNNYVFSIPVYKNMPEGDGGVVFSSDSIGQQGRINVSSSNVRTGPSTYYAKLTSSSGNTVQLSNNTVVNIISKVETDTAYYGSILQYPYWYKISFTYGSEKLEGYVPESFVDITTATVVPAGSYDMTFFRNPEKVSLSLWSTDEEIAQVVDSDTVKFRKEGTVTVVAYDSLGKMDKILFSVDNSSSLSAVSDLEAKVSSVGIEVTFKKSDTSKTELSISTIDGKLLSTTTTDKNTYTFKNLSLEEQYIITAKTVGKTGYSAAASVIVATTVAPQKVTGLSYTKDKDGNLVLSWNAVECSAYAVYCYDDTTGKYTRMGTVREPSFTVPEEYKNTGTYCIRAYIKFNGKNTYGDLSDHLVTKEIPATPSGVTVSEISTRGYKLSWNKVENADGYCIYRLSEGKPVLIETLTQTEYSFTALKPGEAASYKIRAFITVNGEKEFSEYSAEIQAITTPGVISEFKVSKTTPDSVTLSWKQAEGATEYEIYVKSNSSINKLLAVTEETTFVAKELEEVTQYTFSVVAAARNGEAYSSSRSQSVTATTSLSSVSNFSVADSDVTTATLYWDENEKCNGYEVFRYDATKKKYEIFATVETCSIDLENLVPGTEYYFKIRCFTKDKNGKKIYSASSDKLTVVTSVPQFESEFSASDITANSFKLTWEKADGAVSYSVYRYENNKYKKLGSTNKTYYTVKSLKESDLFYYAVSAVYKYSDKNIESEKSELFTASSKPQKPQNLKATPKANGVTLKWDSVKNASFYRVYLYDTSKKKYVAKKDVSEPTYTLSSLGYVKEHKVRIRAYIESDCGIAYSDLAQVNFTTLPKEIKNVKLSSATKTAQTLKWSKSTGATHYYVFRYNSSTKKYDRIAITAKTSYTVKNLKKSTIYTYKIRPVVMKNGKTVINGTTSSAYKFATK